MGSVTTAAGDVKPGAPRPRTVVVRGSAAGFAQEVIAPSHRFPVDEPVSDGGTDTVAVNGTDAAETIVVTGALVTVGALATVNYSNAENLVGKEAFDMASRDEWIESQIALDAAIYATNYLELRKEALEQHQMRVPGADEQVDVD